MNIRLATIKDKKAVLSLLDELINEVNKRSGKPAIFTEAKEIREEREKIYEELIARQDVKIFVAQEGSDLLGMADLFILPLMRRGYYQGHIEDFVVTEKIRGKGIGTEILNAIKEYCKKNNIPVIKLTSSFELEAAHKFYEKNGAKHTEKMFRFDLK
jgi:GNAT superfamily N-acetyltransferase